jgi:predicted kinase
MLHRGPAQKPFLLIISGPPCSGKTTLGRRLAERLGLPFIHKDGIKELLFERLGTGDLAWSSRLSLASYDLLYYFLEAALRSGRPLAVEANFRPERETQKFLELKSRCDFIPIQVLCCTNGEVLLERFRVRAAAGERHPGHLDLQNEPNLLPLLAKGRHEPLEVGGAVLEVDTTDFETIDYAGLYAAVEGEIERAGGQNR